MIEISTAFELIDRHVRSLGNETVPLLGGVGRILRQEIRADMDLPPFDRSQMDGYAVRASDTAPAPVVLDIVGESAAGKGWHYTLLSGQAVRIMTGAPVPKGSDAVQLLELAEESTSDGCQRVRLLESTVPGRFIVSKGSEIKQGTQLFSVGHRITSSMVPALAAFGCAELSVSRKPRVAILATGSEIVDVWETPGPDQIRNSNSAMLHELCKRYGADPYILPNTADDIAALRRCISEASLSADLVILTGGVSVGRYDHTKTAIGDLGGHIYFEKVRLKPGKPAVFAELGESIIFGLPGNPVSAAVTFYLFVRRALMCMQASKKKDLSGGFALLSTAARAAIERDTYLPATLRTNESGSLIASPLEWHGSSDLVGFAGTECLIQLQRGSRLKAGDVAPVLYL